VEVSINVFVKMYSLKGECILTCRGLSPWRVNERLISELGRTTSCLKALLQPEKREERSMAVW